MGIEENNRRKAPRRRKDLTSQLRWEDAEFPDRIVEEPASL